MPDRKPQTAEEVLPAILALPPGEKRRLFGMLEERTRFLEGYVVLPMVILEALQNHATEFIHMFGEKAVSEMDLGNALYHHGAGPRAKADRRRERLEVIRKDVVELRMRDEEILRHLRQEHSDLLSKGAGEVKEATLIREIRAARRKTP
jgi:hypothetical protein